MKILRKILTLQKTKKKRITIVSLNARRRVLAARRGRCNTGGENVKKELGSRKHFGAKEQFIRDENYGRNNAWVYFIVTDGYISIHSVCLTRRLNRN